MTYKMIEPSSWGSIQHEFDARSVPLPDPKLSCIFGAYNNTDELQAFLVCQFKFHSEPLVSYNPLAVPGLLNYAESVMTNDLGLSGIECYISATDMRVRELVWRLGFHPAEPMFVKRLRVTDGSKV